MGDTTKLEDLDTEETVPAETPQTVVTGGELPSQDDEHPAVVGDAQVDDGGIRTNSAVEPIADILATGAGAAHPPPDNVDRDGREVFPGDVAPTALATYDGPGAPAGQGADEADASQHDPGDLDDPEVQELVDGNTAAELSDLADEAGVSSDGTKAEVAKRIVEARRDA